MAEFYGVFSREIALIRQPVKHFTYVERILEYSGKMSNAVEKIEGMMTADDTLHLVTLHRTIAVDFARTQKGYVGYR